MRAIQIVLLGLIGFLTLLYFARFRTKLSDRVIVIAFVAVSCYLLINPDAAQTIAGSLGVGRGVDVLIYFAFVVFGFFYLLILSKLRQLEQQLVDIVRALAIRSAAGPGVGKSDL